MDPVVGFFAGIAIKWLAGLGLEVLKHWTSENEELLHQFIIKITPGEAGDHYVWESIKKLLPWLIEKAAENVDKLIVDNDVDALEHIGELLKNIPTDIT